MENVCFDVSSIAKLLVYYSVYITMFTLGLHHFFGV